jgi:hypothetical protein
MRAAGGAPKSQSWVYRLYGLCCASGASESGSVRRWVGGCRGRWGREMGMGGDLLPRTSGLGVLLNNPQV